MKSCSTCRESKPNSRYHRSRNTTDGLDPRCKDCRRLAAVIAPQDPQRKRDASLRRLYGIGADEYDRLHQEQGGRCAICHQPETMTRLGVLRGLCVDHDHITGKVRGLLCASCNFAIGKFGDDPELMHSAARYLLAAERVAP